MPPANDAIATDGWVAAGYRRLLPLAVAGFAGAALCDWAYSASYTLQWANFAAWLLLAALIGAIPAAMLLAFLMRLGRRTHGGWGALALLIGGAVAGLIGFMIHMRDGATAVIGTGILLSVIAALATIAAAWLSRVSRGSVR